MAIDISSDNSHVLSVVVLPGETAIGDEAFAGYTNLKSVTIPDSVKEIGKRAFYNCPNLRTLDIPKSVTHIGEEAFADCRSLIGLNFPHGIKRIENGTFRGCHSLTDIQIAESPPLPGSDNTYFDIPFGVESIGKEAFAGCRFNQLSVMPLMKSIEDYAFADCHNVTILFIFGELEYIGKGAFSGCTKIHHMRIDAKVPPVVEAKAFDGLPFSSIGLHVPDGSLNAYKEARGWRAFKHIMEGYGKEEFSPD